MKKPHTMNTCNLLCLLYLITPPAILRFKKKAQPFAHYYFHVLTQMQVLHVKMLHV